MIPHGSWKFSVSDIFLKFQTNECSWMLPISIHDIRWYRKLIRYFFYFWVSLHIFSSVSFSSWYNFIEILLHSNKHPPYPHGLILLFPQLYSNNTPHLVHQAFAAKIGQLYWPACSVEWKWGRDVQVSGTWERCVSPNHNWSIWNK